MSTREVMQLALDALSTGKKHQQAIEALRAELAKPEPEPVAWMMENEKYPSGRVLTFGKREGWHEPWKAIPLYRKEDV